MRNIDLIRQVKQQATGRWQGILASLGGRSPLESSYRLSSLWG
ncbi:hypothetical protein ArsFIN_22730 [Arsenophonus nasoniae]|uniref:Uncharacterized protein n=1 Tax=Arsenophonus nasoniae TaxID=638 RepID=A0A4P7KUE8_9GAMM|nr:hypothetical protein ArsFIN_22730 [Arsenophonus nasoniae]